MEFTQPQPLSKSAFLGIDPAAIEVLNRFPAATEEVPDLPEDIKNDIEGIMAKHAPPVDDDVIEAAVEGTETVAVGTEAAVGPVEPSEGFDYGSVANFLADKGLISTLPEGFNVEDVNPENFWSLVETNVKAREQENWDTGFEAARADIASRLNPLSLDILNYQIENSNTTDEEVRSFMENLLYVNDVSLLSPDDPNEAEHIIRQYMYSLGESSKEEIEEMISEYKELGKLDAKATQLKPKLDLRLKQDRQKQVDEQNRVRSYDEALHKDLMQRVDGVLQAGKINGVEIGAEEKKRLWGILSQNKVSVPVNGGKEVELGYLNYLVRKNMYGKEGNLENLLMATLVLEGGVNAVKKFVEAPIKKEVINQFATRAQNMRFASGKPKESAPIKQEEKKKTFWERSLK